MANPTGKGGKKFQPGESGNPSGRPPLPLWVREAKRLTAESFLTCLHEMHDLPQDTLEEISKDKTLPVKSVIMANWLLGSTTSDSERQNLFNRLFGKVTESVEVKMPKPTIITRPNGEQVILGSQLDEGTEE